MSYSFPVDEHTPCYGKGDLFDSRHPTDHAKAKKLCNQCPIRDTACHDWFIETELLFPRHSGEHGAEGTWAGRHINPLGTTGRGRKKAA